MGRCSDAHELKLKIVKHVLFFCKNGSETQRERTQQMVRRKR